MESIGEHLKRVRKTCGYSIDEVARVTRINLHYLEAIENDDFSKIPGDTFIYGFLRSYSRFLGINEQEIIRRFKEVDGTASHDNNLFILSEPEKKAWFSPRTFLDFIKNKKYSIPVGIGIALLFFIFIVLPGDKEDYTAQSSQSVKDVELEKNGLESAEVQDVKVETNLSAKDDKVSETIILKLDAIELTWVQVNVDGKEVKEALLRPGETVSWDGNENITMILGNAGGVNIEVNGEMQEPVGKRGEVARGIVITSSGIAK